MVGNLDTRDQNSGIITSDFSLATMHDENERLEVKKESLLATQLQLIN